MQLAKKWALSIVSILISIPLFIVPFLFILLQALKTSQEASLFQFSWPGQIRFWQNLVDTISAQDYVLVTAFINSAVLTIVSVAFMVVLGAMVAFVLQRRFSRWNGFINFLILSGLIVPPAVVPTIWVLQGTQLFPSLTGLILVEIAFGLSFTILLFRAFIAGIPRELDEAAVIDGAGSVRLFFRVVFPLLRPIIITVVIVQSVTVYSDFVNPLYFTPGVGNSTVQLTLYNFHSQFQSSWNLLFMDILLITIPPLIAFIFANRRIVAGMTGGAIKA